MCFARISFPRRPKVDGYPCWARIEQCTLPGAWYANRVGQNILIEFSDAEGHWAREGGVYNAINIIRHEDARILPFEN